MPGQPNLHTGKQIGANQQVDHHNEQIKTWLVQEVQNQKIDYLRWRDDFDKVTGKDKYKMELDASHDFEEIKQADISMTKHGGIHRENSITNMKPSQLVSSQEFRQKDN
jgi:hypothetical protein